MSPTSTRASGIYIASPVDHFIRTYGTSPAILTALNNLSRPYDADGNPRGLNRTTLAELAGVTYPVVHRTELALFEKIPPKLLRFMETHGHSYDKYPELYRKYRASVEAQHILQERIHASKNLKHWTIEHPDALSVSIPILTFKDWRSRHFGSVMSMAKVILVNPTVIANYENGQTKTLPVGVSRQFKKFGMEQELVTAIGKLECPVYKEEGSEDEDN